MQYLSELPEVGSIGVDGDLIDLELEGRVEELTEPCPDDPVVLIARHGGQIVVVVGQVIKHENFEGKSSVAQANQAWCRIKIKGSSVIFTI